MPTPRIIFTRPVKSMNKELENHSRNAPRTNKPTISLLQPRLHRMEQPQMRLDIHVVTAVPILLFYILIQVLEVTDASPAVI
jgi:hypothetical protein